MHVAVDLGLQRIASNVYDDFLPQEIDLYINRSSLAFVEENVARMRRAEDAERSSDDIRTLIKRVLYTPGSVSSENGLYFFNLPLDFGHYVSCRIETAAGFKNTVKVSPDTLDDYGSTYSNRPLFDRVPVALVGKELHFREDTDGDVPTRVQLKYASLPRRVDLEASLDSDLPEHVHQKIVDLTVALMLGDLNTAQPK